VEAHGGRIWLHASENGATEFRFSLPSEPRTT
jgi:signal transduction histidine kinase